MDEDQKEPAPSAELPIGPQDPAPLIVTHAYFRGPLPPPAVLAAYERIHPGAADRIFTLAERQILHRHRLETDSLQGALRVEARGQWCALVVVLAGMLFGALLTYTGHGSAGLLAMLTPLAGVAAAFLHSRHAQSRERETKRLDLERARISRPA